MIEEENLAKVRKIMQIAKKNYPKANVNKIMHAYEVANTMHSGQKRKSGEPFIDHPIEVALILAEMHAAPDCIAAGMLHDVVEDTSLTIDDVQAEFGSTIAALVDGVTKLKKIGGITKEEQQAENLRKMVMHIAEDPRVVVIKLVDRLHNMRTLQYMNTDQQMKKARETLEIYAPLAHRFGMSKIKWELEDLSFKYLDPIGYEEIEQQLSMTRSNREAFIENIIVLVRKALDESGIHNADIDGRPKHIYSIKRKMENRQKRLDQIFDLLAIRIIVDTEAQCYTVLGIIHHMFNIVDDRFKDYISRPKPNGYRSIHTTVMAKDGTPFEVQIRTHEMHAMAEMGIAAHWRYKEGSKNDLSPEEAENYDWVRTLYESQKDMDSPDEFMEAFKMNLYTDEVFVYTPKGDVKVLPQGSTPIDFAYCIHSDIGNRMVGAKVNGELKPLSYTLQTGDKVDIITTNAPNRGPSRDWLKIVKSPEARSKLRQWFKKERRDENIELGRIMLERELKRQGVTYQELFEDQEIISDFLKRSNFRNIDDMLNSLGFGDITALKIIVRLKDIYAKKKQTTQAAQEPLNVRNAKDTKTKPSVESVSEKGVIVQGMSNCLVKIARCCNPVPGDMIIGYTTRTSGVSVHRADCPNVKAMEETESQRIIQVRWASELPSSAKHTAEIKIEAIDDGQTLVKVANAINEMAIKMTSFSSKNNKDNYQNIDVIVEITDRPQLDMLIRKLETIDTVSKVIRPVR
ncbi:MAG: bifunctional (p)ppGpp synthetase/guanosine-3',5'-bis(diphosphate) 3'-pyrophosphohydrolase [Clostridia bacterium]|nr:bifunctional (p)ppGpp synthetase/guanosine-3',5'-bis(diphosphate) 3'-pyrophosphohydrolase [Clostridia bacterium]